MGLETQSVDGSALCWVAEKVTSSFTGETLEASVARGCSSTSAVEIGCGRAHTAQ